MKAIVQKSYGTPDILSLEEIDTPAIGEEDVLVRVHAAGLHAGDYFCLKGDPYPVRMAVGWPKPKGYVPGYDVAGVVEAVGAKVARFRPGDEVFGSCTGGCAEYVRVSEDMLMPKPANLTFEQAGAVATSALAALHGIRDAGQVKPGHKVLVNGASGGVGTFAVQIARSLGAEVTGVCSTGNLDLVRSLGADHVVDYTEEDFTTGGQQYDLILDNVGNRSFSECRRALTPEGKILPNTGNAGLGYVLSAMFRSLFDRQQGRPYLSKPNMADLGELKELLESEKVTPAIDRTYPLDETSEALRQVGGGHVRGKIVVTVDQPSA